MTSSTLKICCNPIRQRWVFAFMSFLAIVIAYGMRASLSIAITEIAKPIAQNDVSSDDLCPIDESAAKKNVSTSATYDWDEYTQGIILSSFYWGYVVTQLPGALLAEKWGAKHVTGFGILVTGVLTVGIPVAVQWGGSTALIIVRILMGLCEGVTFPALNIMLARWTPLSERSKTGSFVYAGAPLGTVFATTIAGLLLKHADWPVVFYFFGGCSVAWWLFWIGCCYDSPRQHPYISDEEAVYLYAELSEHVHERPPPVPWRHFIASMPMWALIAVTIGHEWGFYTVSMGLPKYMSSVLHFDVEDNGYLSSLPYVGMWLCSLIMSCAADKLIGSRVLSITATRKLGTSVAALGPGLFILGAAYTRCDRVAAVIMFTLMVTLLGSGIPSLKVNALDLSPNYAGTVMAVSNGAAACTGILTPYVVGVLTPQQTLSQWRNVFWIIFGLLIGTNAFYLIFGSGNVVEWNDPEYVSRAKSKEKKLDADNK
ncbi:unnamed protein product [Trichogramma brassicae]|uniref:Major facilitator superfamily (MFS) profile domain-containing protein n=1 Tax=Trichogramma brassicae TaxID=86971 RepID=A0A6H5HWT2_9HYME|nr:unnamed protein product [Trichogramma brassicae]